MSVCSRHFLETDFKGKWNKNAKAHFLRPDAIPSQNFPIILHQNIKSVIDRSKRKIRCNTSESNIEDNKRIKLPCIGDETFNKTDVHDSANTANSTLTTKNFTATAGSSTNPTLLNQGPMSSVDKGTQVHFVSSIEDLLDTEKKCISFTGVGNDVIDCCVICINEVIKANNGQSITNIRKKVVLVLTKLKLNISFACLSIMFDFSPTSCSKYFYTVLH